MYGQKWPFDAIVFKENGNDYNCILHYYFEVEVYHGSDFFGDRYREEEIDDYPYKVSLDDAIDVLLKDKKAQALLQEDVGTLDRETVKQTLIDKMIKKQELPVSHLDEYTDAIMSYYEDEAYDKCEEDCETHNFLNYDGEYEEEDDEEEETHDNYWELGIWESYDYNNDYSKRTRNGYKIVRMYKDRCNDLYIIFKREYTLGNEKEAVVDYNIGDGYDLSDGTWLYGHYDFDTIEQAENYLFNKIFYNGEHCELKQIYANDLDEDYHGSYFWEDDDEYEEAMEEDFISAYWEELEKLTTRQEIEDFVQEHEEEVLEDNMDTDMLAASIMATFGIED